jgi:hypothetical protein
LLKIILVISLFKGYEFIKRKDMTGFMHWWDGNEDALIGLAKSLENVSYDCYEINDSNFIDLKHKLQILNSFQLKLRVFGKNL